MNNRKQLNARGRLITGMAIVLAAGGLAGCANHQASSRIYTFEQTQRAQTVVLANVISVRPIVIQTAGSSGLGAAAGGILGSVAGSSVGGGSGRRLASTSGAIGGAMAGNAMENARNQRQGLEITLQLDDGGVRVIAQEADVPIFAGQRVQVITRGNITRVAPL